MRLFFGWNILTGILCTLDKHLWPVPSNNYVFEIFGKVF